MIRKPNQKTRAEVNLRIKMRIRMRRKKRIRKRRNDYNEKIIFLPVF